MKPKGPVPTTRHPGRSAVRDLATIVIAAITIGLPHGSSLAGDPPGDDHVRSMAAGLELFKGGVRETLATHCLACHGGAATKGDFSLVDRESLLREGTVGPNVVPGKSAESRLFRLVAHLDRPVMPKGKPRLAGPEIAAIARWIDAGAPYDRPLTGDATDGSPAKRDRSIVRDSDRAFWSFRPLAATAAPEVADPNWSRTFVDRYILAKQEAKGLRPTPEASRAILIRRATFDLTGLPPTPEEVAAFEADTRTDAYERLVDRLLASPAMGERWARHWLDLARYAESHGYEQDYDRPHAYVYRDFLVEAFNADMPFDRFVRLQLAGDELEPDDPRSSRATGFLAAGTHATQITANQVEKERYDELDDMAATSGTALLGLTIGCARCHDHKFDPIPTADYYSFAANFTTTVRSEVEIDLKPEETRRFAEAHALRLAPAVAARSAFERDVLPGRLASLRAPATPLGPPAARAVLIAIGVASALPESERTPDQTRLIAAWRRSTDLDWQALDRAVRAIEREAPRPVLTKAMVATEGLPAIRFHTQGADFFDKTYLLKRGDLAQKVGEAPAGFLTVLDRSSGDLGRWKLPPPPGSRTSHRRAALARWITDPEAGAGHLLARVIVNRLWRHHFGRGIVETPSDFGAQGDRPSHPELLDALAVELIRGGWRIKPIHRLLMTSATYRQSVGPEAIPDPSLFAGRPRRRLEAEAIRDAMLAASGLLDPTPGGPGTLDEEMRRRSLYFAVKRSHLIPSMILFDAPDSLVSIGGRATTTVAPQALAILNNPRVRQFAVGLADRSSREGGGAPTGSIDRAYHLALGRPPDSEERDETLSFLRDQAERYRVEGKTDAEASSTAWADACHSLFCLNAFVYVD